MQYFPAEELQGREDFFKVLATTKRSQFATMSLAPGEESGDFGTDHPHADQYLYVLEGEGEARADSGTNPLRAGDLILVPAGEKHQIICTTKRLKTLNFYAPVAYPDEA